MAGRLMAARPLTLLLGLPYLTNTDMVVLVVWPPAP